MKCDFCKRDERKATAKDLIGITWLDPDYMWICDSCLDYKKRSIIIMEGGVK